MCNNCTHKIVCGKFRATGGVKNCEHHKEERKGKWIEVVEPLGLFISVSCNRCNIKQHYEHRFCPNCGADMRGTEDG